MLERGKLETMLIMLISPGLIKSQCTGVPTSSHYHFQVCCSLFCVPSMRSYAAYRKSRREEHNLKIINWRWSLVNKTTTRYETEFHLKLLLRLSPPLFPPLFRRPPYLRLLPPLLMLLLLMLVFMSEWRRSREEVIWSQVDRPRAVGQKYIYEIICYVINRLGWCIFLRCTSDTKEQFVSIGQLV